MFQQIEDNPTRRRVLWMIPLALGGAAFVWFRRLTVSSANLPDKNANTGDLIFVAQFDDHGKSLGTVGIRKVVRSDADWWSHRW